MPVCLDALGDPAPRVAGELERLSGGKATSTPSLLWRRSVRGLRLTPSPVPPLAPLAGPGGRPPTVSAQAICDSDGPPLPPVLDSFTRLPGRGAGRRRPQCRQRANCVGLSLPSDQDSPGPAGPGAAHSVRRGLTVAAAHTFDPHSPSVSPLYGVGCPQCRLRLTVSICVGPRSLLHSLLRPAAGPGAQCRPQCWLRPTVTAAPTSDRILPVCHWSTGAGRLQCRPGANCGGCACLRTVHPYTHVRARFAVSGQVARVGCSAPRRLEHVRLEQSISKSPDPLQARAAVPKSPGF